MTMPATKAENAGLWEVIATFQDANGETRYSVLENRGRTSWRKRTAIKHAREFKALHMRDAWAQPVCPEKRNEPMTNATEQLFNTACAAMGVDVAHKPKNRELEHWENFGDCSIQHGQIWLKRGGDDYAEAVEILNGDDLGEPDNVYIIQSGSVYLAPEHWDSAMACCDSGVYGPPTYSDICYAMQAYHGIEMSTHGGFERVQIGKRDSFGDLTHESHKFNEPDTVLHGNASIERYLRENYLS